MIRSATVVVVGLTGGIGSGKSTVSAMLAELGAVVVDTDVVARQVAGPGGAAHQDLASRFGPDLASDRSRLADLVFADPGALADLNSIVHPAVRTVVQQRLDELARTVPDAVVVVVVPLLVETGPERYGLDRVVVVDCSTDVALERLVKGRGMDEVDARRRIAAQATRDQRLAAADLVIPNTATMEELTVKVRAAWPKLSAPTGAD